MENNSINWAEIYQSLNIEVLKSTGKWMFIATFSLGLIISAISFLVFRKHPIVGIALIVGTLIFSGKYAVGLIRLNTKNPVVYSGLVTGKFETSRTNDGTYSETINYYIKLKVDGKFEIEKDGHLQVKEVKGENKKLKCPKDIYDRIAEGDLTSVLVMPHDNHIRKLFQQKI